MVQDRHDYQIGGQVAALRLIATIVFLVVVALAATSVYRVQSQSMAPSFHPGDYLIVNRLAYGFSVQSLLPGIGNLLPHSYVVRWSEPSRGQIVSCSLHHDGKQSVIFKRVAAVSGDDIEVKRSSVLINGHEYKFIHRQQLGERSPYDEWPVFPGGVEFTYLRYGPFRVPAPGDTIHLTPHNINAWWQVFSSEYPDSLQFHSFRHYVVRDRYIFLLGDNFWDSMDSRLLGPVSTGRVTGRVSALKGRQR